MNELDNTFAEVAQIIEEARDNAYRKVNEELILTYQRIGRFLCEKSKEINYGDGYINSLSEYIQRYFPGIKGFNRRGLYRMKQFYETYAGNEKVSALLTQLSWTNHLLIMSGCKSDEEREFYIRLAVKERYSSRQLERQMESGYYERYMLSKDKLLPEPLKTRYNPFLDSYVVEFLDLPDSFHEDDFREALVKGMRKFILELGKDFTFVGEEYPIQVGGEDYRIDLLFFHRSLRCLVAMELKVGKFKPEYVSKMDFYLEGLDRQIKKSDENPSVGLILCASQNDEVVEYAMSRTLSPMLVAQYQLQLPDKDILRRKLQELTSLPEIEEKQKLVKTSNLSAE
jgi:predicted nuclease of restriction endonuclease-like (RecB) superfamily